MADLSEGICDLPLQPQQAYLHYHNTRSCLVATGIVVVEICCLQGGNLPEENPTHKIT